MKKMRNTIATIFTVVLFFGALGTINAQTIAPLNITTAVPPTMEAYRTVAVWLTATGGTPPYKWATEVDGGVLTIGTGEGGAKYLQIQFYVGTTGPQKFKVKVSDSGAEANNLTVEREFTVNVTPFNPGPHDVWTRLDSVTNTTAVTKDYVLQNRSTLGFVTEELKNLSLIRKQQALNNQKVGWLIIAVCLAVMLFLALLGCAVALLRRNEGFRIDLAPDKHGLAWQIGVRALGFVFFALQAALIYGMLSGLAAQPVAHFLVGIFGNWMFWVLKKAADLLFIVDVAGAVSVLFIGLRKKDPSRTTRILS